MNFIYTVLNLPRKLYRIPYKVVLPHELHVYLQEKSSMSKHSISTEVMDYSSYKSHRSSFYLQQKARTTNQIPLRK